ncbi:hypothetical protein D3C80_1813480 [compost metagenome]
MILDEILCIYNQFIKLMLQLRKIVPEIDHLCRNEKEYATQYQQCNKQAYCSRPGAAQALLFQVAGRGRHRQGKDGGHCQGEQYTFAKGEHKYNNADDHQTVSQELHNVFMSHIWILHSV